jgi:hypothetical protein
MPEWLRWPDLADEDVRERLGRALVWHEEARCVLCAQPFVAGEEFAAQGARMVHRRCVEERI